MGNKANQANIDRFLSDKFIKELFREYLRDHLLDIILKGVAKKGAKKCLDNILRLRHDLVAYDMEECWPQQLAFLSGVKYEKRSPGKPARARKSRS